MNEVGEDRACARKKKKAYNSKYRLFEILTGNRWLSGQLVPYVKLHISKSSCHAGY